MSQKVRVPVSNFAFGEVSPSLLSRTDTPIYAASAQRIENFLIRPEGGVVKRGGMANLYKHAITYDSAKTQQSRLVPFIFSDDEQYIISLEDAQIKVFQINSVTGAVTLIQTITQDTDANALPFDDDYLHEYTFAQAGDVMFICHKNFMVRQLVRTSATTFQVELYVFDTKSDDNLIYQPYYPFRALGVTLDPSATTGSGITIVTSSAHFDTTGSLTGADYLSSLHVGVTLRYHGQELTIVSVQSSTSATADVVDELYQDLQTDALETIDTTTGVVVRHVNHGMLAGDSITFSNAGAVGGITAANINGARTISEIRSDNEYVFTAGAAATSSEVGGGTPRIVTHAATQNWEEQSFSAKRGYPAAVTFHENRLAFAGSPSQPDGIWLSKSSKYYNFDVGDANDDDAIDITVAVGEVSEIRHLVSNRDLQIFGAGGELYIPALSNQALTPTNTQIRRQTSFGCSYARPAPMDGGTLFIQTDTNIIREYIFTDSQAAYISAPISGLSSHLIKTPIEMSVSRGTNGLTDSFAFALNSDGTVAVLNSNRQEQRAGWIEFTSDGSFHSIMVIGDRTFANVVFDTGAGTEEMFLCELDADANVDMSKTYSGTAGVFDVSADFANGAVVDVISGAHYIGAFTVASGDVDVSGVDATLTSVEVGYGFDVELKTNPIDVSSQSGPVTGNPRALGAVVLDLYDTLSVTVNGTDLIIRNVTDDLSEDLTPVTGKREFYLLGYGRDPQVTITQSVPLSLQVNGLVTELVF